MTSTSSAAPSPGIGSGGGGMMSSSSASAAFELPSMPGPYEDFEFSLNLPENITASDFNLVSSPEFSQLFGGNSGGGGGIISFGSGQHGTMSSFSASTPVAIDHHPTTKISSGASDIAPGSGTQTPNLIPTGLDWKGNNNADDDHTPKSSRAPGESGSGNNEMGDTIMSSSYASTNPVLAGSNSSQHQKQSHTDLPQGSIGMLGLVPQPTSMPFNHPPTSAATFHPSGQNMFAFSNQGMQHQQPPNMNMNIQQQGSGMGGLFDANESNFLTNFLSGFEGWDFNPNLPMDLPSFVEAEKQAFQMGTATPPVMGGGSMQGDAKRTPRQRNAFGSIGRTLSKGSPLSTFTGHGSNNSPSSTNRMESSVGAAFGHPMQGWNDDEDEDGSNMHSTSNAVGMGKKMKYEHNNFDGMGNLHSSSVYSRIPSHQSAGGGNYDSRELLSESEKRNNHILSEQRRRNHIREAFKELVDLIEAGREFGARGLGLSSGAGTGIEDEGLDDRSDYESTLEDEEASAATKRRKAKARRRAAMEAARKAGVTGPNGAPLLNGVNVGRGKGRGRGGSAGGRAGSKSAVLFQAVDLLQWLNGRNEVLTKHVKKLEDSLVQPA